MSTPGARVIREGGARGILGGGASALFNLDGECLSCCEGLDCSILREDYESQLSPHWVRLNPALEDEDLAYASRTVTGNPWGVVGAYSWTWRKPDGFPGRRKPVLIFLGLDDPGKYSAFMWGRRILSEFDSGPEHWATERYWGPPTDQLASVNCQLTFCPIMSVGQFIDLCYRTLLMRNTDYSIPLVLQARGSRGYQQDATIAVLTGNGCVVNPYQLAKFSWTGEPFTRREYEWRNPVQPTIHFVRLRWNGPEDPAGAQVYVSGLSEGCVNPQRIWTSSSTSPNGPPTIVEEPDTGALMVSAVCDWYDGGSFQEGHTVEVFIPFGAMPDRTVPEVELSVDDPALFRDPLC